MWRETSVTNDKLWVTLEVIREGIYPHQSLMIDGEVFSRERVRELQEEAAGAARERATGSRQRMVTNSV